MVVVRLAKSGAKKNPYYFITVADSRKPRDGAFIERLGFFNPSAKGSEERMRFNVERLDHWISQGAQLSDKVKELAKDARLSPDDLQSKLDTKKEKRNQKKKLNFQLNKLFSFIFLFFRNNTSNATSRIFNITLSSWN